MSIDKPKNLYLAFLPAKKTAITIYPYILWSRRKQGWENQGILAHEVHHWNEQKIWKETRVLGLSRWLAKYCFYWFLYNLILGHEPNLHPMEKGAYEEQERIAENIINDL